MKQFTIEWTQLKEILSQRPKVVEVNLSDPSVTKNFKFVKDKEGKLYDTGEYWERSGVFFIQDVETKKIYSGDYYESGDRDDMQVFDGIFTFTEVKTAKKSTKKIKKTTKKSK